MDGLLIITIFFAFTTAVSLYFYWSLSEKCSESKIMEIKKLIRVIPLTQTALAGKVPTVDIQFSEKNFPSVVYDDLFTSGNIWQGGYQLDQGRTSTTQTGIAKRPVTSVSGYVPAG